MRSFWSAHQQGVRQALDLSQVGVSRGPNSILGENGGAEPGGVSQNVTEAGPGFPRGLLRDALQGHVDPFDAGEHRPTQRPVFGLLEHLGEVAEVAGDFVEHDVVVFRFLFAQEAVGDRLQRFGVEGEVFEEENEELQLLSEAVKPVAAGRQEVVQGHPEGLEGDRREKLVREPRRPRVI